MYKKALGCLAALNLLFLLKALGVGAEEGNWEYQQGSEREILREEKTSVVGIASVAASGQRIIYWDRLEPTLPCFLEREELEILQRIVEAEAGGEDLKGRILVANVVLNRVESDIFPDTVSEVVFQQEQGVSQFSPVSDGRYEKVAVSKETKEAVLRALSGENISGGALYFAAREHADSERMRWFDENLTFLFRYGGHEFFK